MLKLRVGSSSTRPRAQNPRLYLDVRVAGGHVSLVGPRRPLNLEMLTIDQGKIANGHQNPQHRSHDRTLNNGFKLE